MNSRFKEFLLCDNKYFTDDDLFNNHHVIIFLLVMSSVVIKRPDVHSLQDTSSISRPYVRNEFGSKPNSTYVPHNRLSRYATALTSLVPVRFRRYVS